MQSNYGECNHEWTRIDANEFCHERHEKIQNGRLEAEVSGIASKDARGAKAPSGVCARDRQHSERHGAKI